jgi:phage tail-like protein
VLAYTRAADEEGALEWQPWQPEPALYFRSAGAELPYYHLWSEDELRHPGTGTWELLFQNVRGRYLQMRLELAGNRRTTPAIRALRVHYPRFSYLTRYLPALYQDDPISASFIERFLANPEGMLTRLEGLIADVQVFFDVRTTEAVDWLGSWLGLAFNPAWSDYQRRLLIAHAAYFFLRRGTLPGVMQAIRLTLDPSPDIFQDEQDSTCARLRIVERFRTRYTTHAVLGDPTSPDTPLTGDAMLDARLRAHRFIVLLPSTVTPSQVDLVEQIVNVEKPAHTDFIIRQFWALFRVGEVRLGIDTTLGEGGRFEILRLDRTALAEGYLGEDYPYNLTDRTVLTS